MKRVKGCLNSNCKEYKKVKTMWEQTFPIKEERDYALKLYASTLSVMI
jgi:hypothetical protein